MKRYQSQLLYRKSYKPNRMIRKQTDRKQLSQPNRAGPEIKTCERN